MQAYVSMKNMSPESSSERWVVLRCVGTLSGQGNVDLKWRSRSEGSLDVKEDVRRFRDAQTIP